MPAFSAGLRRNTQTATGLESFLAALGSGQHQGYYQNPFSAFDPTARGDGNGILGHLFGSRDVSRQIASQVSQATGISETILKQMLPALASMIMGGLFNQARGGNNPIGELLEQFTGGRSSRRQREPENPLGDLIGSIFGQMMGAQPQREERRVPTGADIFGKMFDAGADIQNQQVRQFEALIEQMTGRR